MPKKFLLHIVAVVTTLAIVLTCNAPVSAQENNGVFAQHQLWLTLRPDLSAVASYDITILNNNQQLVSELTLQLPFKTAKAQFVIDGEVFDLEPQLTEKGSDFHVAFPGNAILPSQTKTLKFTFETGTIVSNSLGLMELHIGKVNADHIITDFQLHVNYPASFPKLIYTSAINSASGNEVFLVGLNGMLIQWSNGLSGEISETVSLDFPAGHDNVLFNLPYDGRYQQLTYLDLQNLGLAATDKAGNTWGIAQSSAAASPVSYKLQLKSRSTANIVEADYPVIDYTKLALRPPEQLVKLSETSKQKRLKAIYDYIVQEFSAAQSQSGTATNLQGLTTRINGGERSLNNVEMAYVAANYCQYLRLTCNVVYGYLLGNDFNDVHTSRPHIWLEAFDDVRGVIIDPYLRLASGEYNFYDVPSESRLVMGVWNPDLSEDSILGAILGNARTRPTLGSSNLSVDNIPTYSISSTFPAQIRGGEFYSGRLTATNQSGKFIKIKSLVFDGREIAPQILKISDQLERVILPLGDTIIGIEWQREPNFLADETRELVIRVIPEDSSFQTLEATTHVTFIPNNGLLGAILIALIILIVLIGMLLMRLWVQQSALEKRLVESRRRRKQKVAELEAREQSNKAN